MVQSISRVLETAAPSAPDVATRSCKRVLIVALNYAPELVGCAKYTTELAEDLVARGHAVEVVTGPPYYPDWKVAEGHSGARWSRERRAGVTVHRTPLYVPVRPSGLKRVAHLASFGLAATPMAIAVARRFRPDLVFAVAPTLAAAGAALAAAKVSGARSWLHVQDFEVDAAFELGLLKGRRLRAMGQSLERTVLNAFDRVSSISPAMVLKLQAKGIGADRTLELRNWVDVGITRVFASSNTRYRNELGIPKDRIVALYAGNMAEKQGLESLVDVARELRRRGAPISLLLCGEGPGRAALETACRGLENVHFLPLQPIEHLPELLGTADVHLLPQRPQAADLVLPSKLTGMLASGRPVIAMAEPGTGLALEVEGCGLAVLPTGTAMTQALLQLSTAPELRLSLGVAGRRRAETVWNKKANIDTFETALASLLESAG